MRSYVLLIVIAFLACQFPASAAEPKSLVGINTDRLEFSSSQGTLVIVRP